MADVQRAGRDWPRRIRRRPSSLRRSRCGRSASPCCRACGDFALVGGRAHVEIDEARACDLDLRDVVAGGQRVDQRLRQRARIAARRFGQQHRRVAGEIAVARGSLGRSTTKSGVAVSAGKVPALRRASMPWAIRARSWDFTEFCWRCGSAILTDCAAQGPAEVGRGYVPDARIFGFSVSGA